LVCSVSAIKIIPQSGGVDLFYLTQKILDFDVGIT